LVYDRYAEFQDLKEEIYLTYKVRPKCHEIMSFLIVRSPYFQEYFTSIIKKIKSSEHRILESIDFNELAGFIIGYSIKPSRKYLSDIINGPIDCDKLDYLARDATFAGPVIAYDIDRYLYTVNIVKTKKVKRLTVSLAGINVIEQILISKMMMFSYVYHHHKVRAVEAMIKRFCFDIKKERFIKNNKTKITLKHPVDFLNYTDENIFNSFIQDYGNSDSVKETISLMINRRLWVRAMLISCFNIDVREMPTNLLQLERSLHNQQRIDRLNELKEKIIARVLLKNPNCTIRRRDIWIDVPFPPSAEEPKQIEVKIRSDLNETIPLSEAFPLEQWIDAYKRTKLRVHIFCEKRFQLFVYKASKEVLEEEYAFKIYSYTNQFCKIPEDEPVSQ